MIWVKEGDLSESVVEPDDMIADTTTASHYDMLQMFKQFNHKEDRIQMVNLKVIFMIKNVLLIVVIGKVIAFLFCSFFYEWTKEKINIH